MGRNDYFWKNFVKDEKSYCCALYGGALLRLLHLPPLLESQPCPGAGGKHLAQSDPDRRPCHGALRLPGRPRPMGHQAAIQIGKELLERHGTRAGRQSLWSHQPPGAVGHSTRIPLLGRL